MHRGLAQTAARVERLLRHRLEPAVLSPAHPLEVAAGASRPEPGGEPGEVTPVTLPWSWGPPWHTTWIRVRGTVPQDWAGQRVVAHVDLGFTGRGDGFQAEGLVWQDGRLRHALQPDRRTVIVADPAVGGEVVTLWIEAASNPIMADDPTDLSYRPTVMGDPATAGDRPRYELRCAELAVLQGEVQALVRELRVVADLAAHLPVDDPRSPGLERVCEAVIGAVDLDDVVGSAASARALLAPVLQRRGTPARHGVVAVGHAHLDTAWLWPVRETRRKARRTFANAVDLADRFPEFRFAHSQAQHWAWVAHDDPDLFARIADHVAAGRIEPVGGMWVEADLNLSGGESLVRQLLHGQHAFHTWFGTWCGVGFLPDDFGYPASLPQILVGGGCRAFFTQKLSWNETNRFPHHTFWWEGLDGSRVLTHFSPVETYNAVMTPGQLRFAAANFADHAVSDVSLVCFGHGDGGGGPTADMLERIRLFTDLDGVPPVQLGTVAGFFDRIAAQADAPEVWAGEIVLEKHRGTYTSQVATKQGNLASEVGLRAAELWSVAVGHSDAVELRQLWERVLVEQFHDILPGSSIAWVHRDAERTHTEVAARVSELIRASLGDPGKPQWCVANAAPVAVHGVVELDAVPGLDPGVGVQVTSAGTWVSHVGVDAMSSTPWHIAQCSDAIPPVSGGVASGGGVWMDNTLVRVVVDSAGRMVELIDRSDPHAPRSVLRPNRPGARLVLHGDQPGEYDAWDIDQPDARRPPVDVPPAHTVELVDAGPLLVRVRCTHRTGASTLVHELTLCAGASRVDHRLNADWHESERRLSYVVPVDVAGTSATAGVQFGHVSRQRHTNTSWQAAQFEQVAHRYVHVGETRFGVALLFAGPRGVDMNHPDRHMGLSLLRSSRYPDPTADRGRHRIEWSVAVTSGDPWGDGRTTGIEVEAQRLTHRVQWSGHPVPSLVHHDLRGVIVETIKAPHLATDDPDDVILRLWEAEGARVQGRVRLNVPGRQVVDARRCDLLERDVGSLDVDATGAVTLTLQPFELVSLRLRAHPMTSSG